MGYALNQLLIGLEPSAIPEQAKRSDNPLAEKRVEQLCHQWTLAVEALNKATNSTKPSTPQWKPGQKVWLEAKNLALPYGTVKLAPR